jgi:hypothetical protein
MRQPGRSTALRLAVSLALCLGWAACKGDSAKQEGPPAGRPDPAPAVSFLPKDTGFVVGLSVAQVKASKLWEKFGPVLLRSRQQQLATLKTECGIDPLEIESIVIAGDSSFDERTMVVAIKTPWTEDKVDTCFAKLTEKNDGKKLAIAKDGKLTKYSIEGGDDLYAYWTGMTVVVTPGMLQDKFRLSEIAAGATSAKDNAALMDLLANVDTGGTLWSGLLFGTGRAAPKVLGAMDAGTPRSLYGTLRFTSTFDLSLGLGFADEQQAKITADKLAGKLASAKSDPTLGPFVGGATVTTSGTTAFVKVALDANQVDQLLALVDQQFGPMLPMLLGGN